MKNNLISILIGLLLLSGCDSNKLTEIDVLRTYHLHFYTFVDVSSGNINGRIDEDSAVLTYYFIEIFDQSGDIYASGVFSHLDTYLEVFLLSNNEYAISAKAIRNSTGYGLAGEFDGVHTVNGFEVTNKFQYAAAKNLDSFMGMASVFSNADSSETVKQSYPILDTYFGRIYYYNNYNNYVNIELRRKVFGVETHVLNMQEGSITVVIGEEPNPTFQRIAAMDSLAFDILSFSWLHESQQSIPIKIYLEKDEEQHIIYDQTLSFLRLEKKVFRIDFNSVAAGNNSGVSITIIDEPLFEGQVIDVN